MYKTYKSGTAWDKEEMEMTICWMFGIGRTCSCPLKMDMSMIIVLYRITNQQATRDANQPSGHFDSADLMRKSRARDSFSDSSHTVVHTTHSACSLCQYLAFSTRW